MLIIGLTGGIGSGKSLAAEYFSELGVPVIDADQVARDVVMPGTEGLQAIVDSFGPDFLATDGSLDRKALRVRIFSDPDQRHRLEAILHPRIRQTMREQAARLSAPYCLFVIPLLLETGQQDSVDRILVIDAPESVQRERAMLRDGSNAEQIDAIMAAQVSRQARLAAADDIIENTDSPAALKTAVEELHQAYLRLASETKKTPAG
jgi:dephospho-CoA kinase